MGLLKIINQRPDPVVLLWSWIYSIFATALIGGWVIAGIFPETTFGNVFNSKVGHIVWGRLLLLVFFPIERIFVAKGKRLIRQLLAHGIKMFTETPCLVKTTVRNMKITHFVTIVCTSVSVNAFSEDLVFPADFDLLINPEHELSEYGKPHPCGSYLELHGLRIPTDNKLFLIDFAYELDGQNKVINKWPLPLDAVPKSINGNRLTILVAGTNNYIHLWPNGALSEVLDFASLPEPQKGECPESSLPGGSSHYYCSALIDITNENYRIIATFPVCT